MKMRILAVLLASMVAATAVHAYFLEDEAGISVYAQTAAINLTYAASAYNTIEYQDENYIIGQVDVGYGESYMAHAYAHKDGWIVAYYLNTEPTAKMLKWDDYDGITVPGSKLETALYTVASASGVGVANITFYDFRYPNANRLMIILERRDTEGTDEFQVRIPGSFSVYERSWSLHHYDANAARYYLNTVQIANLPGCDNCHRYADGFFTLADMLLDQYHTLGVFNDEYSGRTGYSDCALTLTYLEP